MCVFLTVLGLWQWLSPSCSEWGCCLAVVLGLLTVWSTCSSVHVGALVACGLSSCRSQALQQRPHRWA